MNTVQISATISVEIQQKIAAIAHKEGRSFSKMVEILLKKSVK